MNKSWWQHPMSHQLYGHLPPITKTIQVRRTRHDGTLLEKQGRAHKWCTPMGPPQHMAVQKQDDQLELTYSNYVEDTGCNHEDLPEAMNDWEKWRERVRDIRAGGTTWWWWWLCVWALKVYSKVSFGQTLFVTVMFRLVHFTAAFRSIISTPGQVLY